MECSTELRNAMQEAKRILKIDPNLGTHADVVSKVDGINAMSDSKIAELKAEDARAFKGGSGEITDSETLKGIKDRIAKIDEKLADYEPRTHPFTGEEMTPTWVDTARKQKARLEDKLVDAPNADDLQKYEDYQMSDSVYSGSKDNTIDKSIDYEDYAKEIKAYTGEDYYFGAKVDRGGREIVQNVQKFLDNTPENFSGVSYRGSRLTAGQVVDLRKSLKNGDVIRSTLPISSSTDAGTAVEFGKGSIRRKRKDAMFTFKGSGHDIKGHSTMGEEDEVLINSDKIYELVNVVETDMQVQILLKEITKDAVGSRDINNRILSVLGIGTMIGAASGTTANDTGAAAQIKNASI